MIYTTDEIDKPFRRDLLSSSSTGDRAAKSRDRGCTPGRGSSSSPSTPCSTKRRRHLPTVCGVTRSPATALLLTPAAQPGTMRARNANACAVSCSPPGCRRPRPTIQSSRPGDPSVLPPPAMPPLPGNNYYTYFWIRTLESQTKRALSPGALGILDLSEYFTHGCGDERSHRTQASLSREGPGRRAPALQQGC